MLNDGHQFNAEVIPEAKPEVLIEFAVNDTTIEALPKIFYQYEEEKEGVQARAVEIM